MERVEAVTIIVLIDGDKRLLTLRSPTRTVVLQTLPETEVVHKAFDLAAHFVGYAGLAPVTRRCGSASLRPDVATRCTKAPCSSMPSRTCETSLYEPITSARSTRGSKQDAQRSNAGPPVSRLNTWHVDSTVRLRSSVSQLINHADRNPTHSAPTAVTKKKETSRRL